MTDKAKIIEALQSALQWLQCEGGENVDAASAVRRALALCAEDDAENAVFDYAEVHGLGPARAGVQEPVAWISEYNQELFHALTSFQLNISHECTEFMTVPVFLGAAPPSSQYLIDSARMECARVCEAEHVGESVYDQCDNIGDMSYNIALRHAAIAIRALIGQPLNEAKGG